MKKYKRGKRAHSKDVVISASQALTSAQKKDKQTMSSKDAILHIKKNILAARKRGMTWIEIAEIVKTAGLDVDIATIKIVVGKTEKMTETKQTKKPAPAPAPAQSRVSDRMREEVQKKAPAAVAAGGFKIDLTSAADI